MRTLIVVRTFIGFALCLLFIISAFAHPGSGIVVDKQGNIYFTDTGEGVWKIDKQGKLTYLPASKFHWMALDETGYFKESQKTFGEYFERVTPQSSKPVLMICSDFPVTVNRDGNIYYADTRPNSSKIIRRTPEGKESVLAEGKMFQGISGITAGSDGSLYVTDASKADANVIRKISTEGTVSIVVASEALKIGKTGDTKPSPETDAGYCRGLAVDSQSVLFVAATGSRRILKIDHGKASVILQSQSPWSPTGVTVFQGEVYVLEWCDPEPSRTEVRKAWIPRVRKIARDGTITILATVSR